MKTLVAAAVTALLVSVGGSPQALAEVANDPARRQTGSGYFTTDNFVFQQGAVCANHSYVVHYTVGADTRSWYISWGMLVGPGDYRATMPDVVTSGSARDDGVGSHSHAAVQRMCTDMPLGTYTLNARLNVTTVSGATEEHYLTPKTFTVSAYGTPTPTPVPTPTPTPTTGTTIRPTAKVIVVERGPVYNVVKVVLGNRRATVASEYRVTKSSIGGSRTTFITTKFKVVRYSAVRAGTRVTVRFGKKIVGLTV